MVTTTKWLGANVKRKEDPKFLTGRGQYADDVEMPGTLHLAILRSPYAHANIRHIDTSVAKQLSGVVTVVTGKEARKHYGPLARTIDIMTKVPETARRNVVFGSAGRCRSLQRTGKRLGKRPGRHAHRRRKRQLFRSAGPLPDCPRHLRLSPERGRRRIGCAVICGRRSCSHSRFDEPENPMRCRRSGARNRFV